MKKNWIPAFEFWPVWLIYAPMLVYYPLLALKVGTLRWIVYVNPSEPLSGLLDLDKSRRLQQILDKSPKNGLKMELFDPKRDDIDDFLVNIEENVLFPCVLKATNGFRGGSPAGFVAKVVYTAEEAKRCLNMAKEVIIAQEFCDYTEEYGVMWVKMPNEKHGRVTSLMKRDFLHVIGDGTRNIEQLLNSSKRNQQYLEHIRVTYPERLSEIPHNGEKVVIEPIGNHCRGTIFRNWDEKITEKLADAFLETTKDISGLFYGRFDVKTKNFADLEAGNFKIVEVNETSADPASIYAPEGTFWHGITSILQHWWWAAEIARQNYKNKVETADPRSIVAILRQFWHYFVDNNK